MKQSIRYIASGVLVGLSTLALASSEVPVLDRSNTFVNATDSEAFAAEDFDTEKEANASEKNVSSQNRAAKKQIYNNARLLAEIESLRQELNELRGEMETQTHDLKLLKDEQAAFYKDIDSRLLAKSSNGGPKLAMVEEESTNEANRDKIPSAKRMLTLGKKKPDEQLSYAYAYEQIQTKQYANALAAMNEYIHNFPDGSYTANAYYWKGELLLKESQYENAAKAFDAVIQKFPDSTKVAPSMYKLGSAYALLGASEKAEETLEKVISQFPDTATARLARTKLTSLHNSVT